MPPCRLDSENGSNKGIVEKRNGDKLHNSEVNSPAEVKDLIDHASKILLKFICLDLEIDNLRVAEETTLGRASVSGKEDTDRTHKENDGK